MVKFYGFQRIIDNIRGKEVRKLKTEIDSLNYEISQLKYLMCQIADPQNFKPAQGALRQYQLIQSEMVRVFDYICRKYNISYWLDFGTLLGAFRHKGFIPWDDDIDIGMLRSDIVKIPEIVEKELGGYGFSVNIGEGNFFNTPIVRIVYDGLPWGQIDIFPYDNYYKEIESEQEKIQINHELSHANSDLIKGFLKNRNIEYLNKKRKEVIDSYVLKGNSPQEGVGIFLGAEFHYSKPCVRNLNDIFPLRELTFEGVNLFVPKDFDKYLKDLYGDYMRLPKRIFQHSPDVVWRESDRNMDDLYKKIKHDVQHIISQNCVA